MQLVHATVCQIVIYFWRDAHVFIESFCRMNLLCLQGLQALYEQYSECRRNLQAFCWMVLLYQLCGRDQGKEPCLSCSVMDLKQNLQDVAQIWIKDR